MSVHFTILGTPAPQGSKTRMPNGAMVEASSATGRAKLRDWRSACTAAAAEQAALGARFGGPVRVHVSFTFRMPRSRPKAVRERGTAYKVGKPDLDKLCRALGDSMVAGGLIARDELIVAWVARKVERMDGPTGAIVEVWEATL